MIASLRIKLMEWDPNRWRLKNAFKTVLALAIAVLVTWKLPLFMRFLGGLAAGFLIQNVPGRVWYHKVGYLFLSALAYTATYVVGRLTYGDVIWSYAWLVVLAFLVTYVRRYGTWFVYFPLIAWVFAFFSVIFPDFGHLAMWQQLLGLWIGFVVAALVYFVVFPVNYINQFNVNVQQFLYQLSFRMRYLSRVIRKPVPYDVFASQQADFVRYSREALMQNQSMVTVINATYRHLSKTISKAIMLQFTVGKAGGMLYESMAALLKEKVSISENKKAKLIAVTQQYVHLLHDWHFTLEDQRQFSSKKLQKAGEQLAELQKIVGEQIVSSDEAARVNLVNYVLGLTLLHRNLMSLQTV